MWFSRVACGDAKMASREMQSEGAYLKPTTNTWIPISQTHVFDTFIFRDHPDDNYASSPTSRRAMHRRTQTSFGTKWSAVPLIRLDKGEKSA